MIEFIQWLAIIAVFMFLVVPSTVFVIVFTAKVVTRAILVSRLEFEQEQQKQKEKNHVNGKRPA